jgi:molybdate transport system regulatory protein
VPRLKLRIDFDDERAIGPGKIELLELIDALGSISAAGRRMKMSYRRAWLLVDALSRCFRQPLVASHAGGAHGGGATLTPAGCAVDVGGTRCLSGPFDGAVVAHEGLSTALAEPGVPVEETNVSKTASWG